MKKGRKIISVLLAVVLIYNLIGATFAYDYSEIEREIIVEKMIVENDLLLSEINNIFKKSLESIPQTRGSAQYVLDTVYFYMRAPFAIGPWAIDYTTDSYKTITAPIGYHYESTGGYNFYIGQPISHLNGTYYTRDDRAVANYILVRD